MKEEQMSIAKDLEFAQGSYLEIVEAIDSLYSELDGRYTGYTVKL